MKSQSPASGLGMVPNSSAYKDSWSGDDPAVLNAAEADDIAGNGIFDGAGAPPTAHANTGVFASNFSLPGYLYREQPTEPSEIRDTTTGNPVVYQPGPADWYADMRETYRPFDLETPRYYQNQDGAAQPKSMQGLGDTSSIASSISAYAPWLLLGGGLALAVMVAIKMMSAPAEAWAYGE